MTTELNLAKCSGYDTLVVRSISSKCTNMHGKLPRTSDLLIEEFLHNALL